MPKSIITIDDFSFGILTDKTIPAKNGYHFSAGLDIHSDEGILQPSQALKVMAEDNNAINGGIYWMTNFTNSANAVFGYNSHSILKNLKPNNFPDCFNRISLFASIDFLK